MSFEEIEKLDLSKSTDKEFVESKLSEYYANYLQFNNLDILKFVHLYFKYACFKNDIKCKFLLKEIENNALSCYSLEDDAVEFNPNRIKTLKINAEKTNYKSYDNIVSLTTVIEHELRHKQQYEQMHFDYELNADEIKKLMPNILLMAKEYIATNYYSSFAKSFNHTAEENLYLENYNKMIIEMDADFYALSKAYENIKHFNDDLSEKFLIGNEKYYKKIKNILYNPENIVHKDIEKTTDNNEEQIFAQFKYSLICDNAVKQDKSIIKEMPIFKLVYKENGDKRTYQELMTLRNQLFKLKDNKETDFSNDNLNLFDVFINNDPLLKYQQQLSLINGKNFNFNALQKIGDEILALSSKLDGRYFEDFSKITSQELFKLSQEYNKLIEKSNKGDNVEEEIKFVTQKRQILRLLFEDIVEQNEKMNVIKQQKEKKYLNAIKLVNNTFNIDVNKIDLNVDESKILGKFRYSKNDLLDKLETMKPNLTDEEVKTIEKAINIVRPFEKDFNKNYVNGITQQTNNDKNQIKET